MSQRVVVVVLSALAVCIVIAILLFGGSAR